MDNETNDDEIAQLAIQARAQRGGKPTKYVHLDRYSEIVKLVAADVQLPFILKWLADEKQEVVALNTLRKYVIFKIGRTEYDEYLRRNGWLKKKRIAKPVATPIQPTQGTQLQTPPALQPPGDETISTSPPKTGFHLILDELGEQNSNADPRRND